MEAHTDTDATADANADAIINVSVNAIINVSASAGADGVPPRLPTSSTTS
jgi:hypothetical protein